ncbi:MAG: hypothetical protein NT034_03180, partial [Candidatus Magasanikbacteria bacterium]|nr:hypothetical protein [Candidatus Magasanikbacteria bacterium]
MSEKSHFGESFHISAENRTNPLDKNTEIPEYVRGAQGVRALLQEAARESGEWKEMPADILGVEDIIEKAKEKVTSEWTIRVTPYIAEKCKVWCEQLEQFPEYAKEKELLADSVTLEEKLRIRQFGVLESLRNVLPDIWRELILISSERQLAAVEVARQWIKNLPKDREQEILEKCDIKNIKELEIYIDSAALLAKYADHAYVKQLELADAPGGSSATPLGELAGGVRYLYDIDRGEENGGVEIKSYADVFPFEIQRLQERFNLLADKVDAAFEVQEIGLEYKNLSAYLRKMADAYGSKVIDPDALAAQWQSLMNDMKDLYHEGCPVMFVPQALTAVAGEANKMDVEIRFGYITKESKELTEVVNFFRSIVGEILTAQRPYYAKDQHVPEVIINYQPFATGHNSFWTLRGEGDADKILAHTNAVVDVAKATALPALRSVFEEEIDEKKFTYATILENLLHELGHTIAPPEDAAVGKRVGVSAEMYVAEELKADTCQMKILSEAMKAGKGDVVDIKAQFIAQLGDVCDYLKNKSDGPGTSGERYYYDGVEVIYNLIEKGVIVESNG